MDFKKERLDIVHTIFNILNLSDSNNSFILSDFNDSHHKKQQIIDLIPLIRKFFDCKQWNCIKDAKLKNREISIIRTVLKYMDFELSYKQKNKKLPNGKYDTKIIYFVNTKNN